MHCICYLQIWDVVKELLEVKFYYCNVYASVASPK